MTSDSNTDNILKTLEAVIAERQASPKPGSYTNELLAAGLPRIAQKVGEEGVETVVAALAQDDAALLGEVADLMYHLTVLLAVRGQSWDGVNAVLAERHLQKSSAKADEVVTEPTHDE